MRVVVERGQGSAVSCAMSRDSNIAPAAETVRYAGFEGCGLLPVSYTHLDVYKRQ